MFLVTLSMSQSLINQGNILTLIQLKSQLKGVQSRNPL